VDATVEHLDRGSDRIALHTYADPAAAGAGAGGGPFALILPAMGVPARYYRPFAAALHAEGFAVVAADLRGNGASTPLPDRRSRYGYAELVDDIAAMCAALAERRGTRPLLLVGHSLGGQAALLHLALRGGADVAGVALVATGLPYWRNYPGARRYGVLAFSQTIGVVSSALGVWPGWGFGGRQARRVMTDWAYTARAGRYPRLAGADAEAALATVRTPVLVVSVDSDAYTPAPVVDHLAAKLTAAPIERAHIGADTLDAPIDHFKWVRAAGAPIAARISRFAAELRSR
jgi:predicted alpha/beta hydrolase